MSRTALIGGAALFLGLLVGFIENLLRTPDFKRRVTPFEVDRIISADPHQVYYVLKIPAYQYIGAAYGRNSNMPSVHKAPIGNNTLMKIGISEISRFIVQFDLFNVPRRNCRQYESNPLGREFEFRTKQV